MSARIDAVENKRNFPCRAKKVEKKGAKVESKSVGLLALAGASLWGFDAHPLRANYQRDAYACKSQARPTHDRAWRELSRIYHLGAQPVFASTSISVSLTVYVLCATSAGSLASCPLIAGNPFAFLTGDQSMTKS